MRGHGVLRMPWATGNMRLALLGVLGVFLPGCLTPAAAEYVAESTGIAFDRHDIVTGPAKHQTVLTGAILGGPVAELAVVSVDVNGGRRLSLYTFGDGNWAQKLDAALRNDVWFVDVANIGGRDRLLTYQPGLLNWLDSESGTERALVTVASDMAAPPGSAIPHVDVTRDVNGDGRDDLVVPNSDGFWVFTQEPDGAFADPVKIGPAFDMSGIYAADGYRHSPWDQGRIHHIDYNRDGRSDLVFWDEDHFEVHLQNQWGLFAPSAETFTTEVTFDSDDLATLAAPHGVRGRRMDHGAPGAMTGRVLHSLTDVNGDGVADLVVFALEGGSQLFGQMSELWSMHSAWEVHFGLPTPEGGTAFAAEVGAVIRSDGIPFGLAAHDFNHDGRTDVMFTLIDPGIFKAVGMLLSAAFANSVSMDLEFYLMNDGGYPNAPSARRKITTHPSDRSGGRTRYPAVLIGDANGDGRSDLLLQEGDRELRVFPGVAGPDVFARQPLKVAVAIPRQEYTWLADLNQDGKQDVLMHHPSTTAPHRITLLIAR